MFANFSHFFAGPLHITSKRDYLLSIISGILDGFTRSFRGLFSMIPSRSHFLMQDRMAQYWGTALLFLICTHDALKLLIQRFRNRRALKKNDLYSRNSSLELICRETLFKRSRYIKLPAAKFAKKICNDFGDYLYSENLYATFQI